MCLIEYAVFDKNGSSSFNCTAKQADKIDVDIGVIFEADDPIPGGFWADITVNTPDGSKDFLSPVKAIPNDTTSVFDFIVPIPTTKTGKYTLTEVDIMAVGMIGGCRITSITQAPGTCTSITVTGIPTAKIFNWCWGPAGTVQAGKACPYPAVPSNTPIVTQGSQININVDIANTGGEGGVMVIFKINGVGVYNQTNNDLQTYGLDGLWSVTYSGYTMPSSSINLEIDTYGWSGSDWTKTDARAVTISSTKPACSSVTVDPIGGAIIKGPVLDASGKVVTPGEKVTITATVSPTTVSYPVSFKYRDGTVIGTCNTDSSSGKCQYIFDTNNVLGKSVVPGTYYITAYSDSCQSAEIAITVSAPITQYNLTIYVIDNVSHNPVVGASVQATTTGMASQTLVADASGKAVFRVNSGDINISISADKYNTLNDYKYVFSDTTLQEYLVPTPVVPTTGSILFVTIPVGAHIFIDGKDTGQLTAGSCSCATVSGLSAGDHSYKLTLSGYNDSTGTITVQGGSTVTVPITMTTVTPTTGSVAVNSNPMGAEIWIDGTDSGEATSGMTVITNIPPGTHSLLLKMTGFQDYKDTFTITAGQTTHLNETLVPVVTIGSLEIDSNPSGGIIYIDDKSTGYNTPATINNLIEGSHSYKVTLTGYLDLSGKFDIIAGKTTIINLILQKTTTSEVGTGVLIAVGGALAVGLLLAKGEEKGEEKK